MKSVFRKLSLLLGGSSLLFLLSACSKVSGLGYEEGVTSINDHSLSLWQGAWIAAAVVGAITLILIIWPAIFHRHKEGKPEFPKQVQYNIPIEIVYTVVPFIIVSVLFYFTAVKQSAITKLSPDAQVAHTIEVKGIQWSWQFSYPEAGNKRKLAAGWLIDQCGLKGQRMGNVGVYENQALVLVNHGGGTAQDILGLAKCIQDAVHSKFGVKLEIEPNIF